MNLKNKHILLTGASGGIGMAIAIALDKQGAVLSLVGRNADSLAALREQLSSAPHQLVVADINSAIDRLNIGEHCRDNPLDILINCAGVLELQYFASQEPASIDSIINTNLLSPMQLCRDLIPLLNIRSQAAIVNIGSIFGSIGHPGFTAYCASKFGLHGFTQALQRELAGSAIYVGYLAPRATETKLNSLAITAMNKELGNSMDDPAIVAKELLILLGKNQPQRFMGWPERIFVKINALLPNLVAKSLIQKLPLIKKAIDQQRSTNQ